MDYGWVPGFSGSYEVVEGERVVAIEFRDTKVFIRDEPHNGPSVMHINEQMMALQRRTGQRDEQNRIVRMVKP